MTAGSLKRGKARLRQLYEGGSPVAHRFRYGLLVFDLASLVYVVATSFLPRSPLLELLDVLIGLVMLADFGARFFISNHRLRDLLNPFTWADIGAIVSFLAALVAIQWGFNKFLVIVVNGFFLLIDLIFFAANSMKFLEGGWFPLLLAGAIAFLMLTWRRGQRLVEKSRSAMRESEREFINKLHKNGAVTIGHKVRLDLSKVSADDFTAARREYHKQLQEEFFGSHKIAATETYTVKRGDSLWTIAQQHGDLPVWLISQYNPDVTLSELHPGTSITLPQIASINRQ